MASDPVFSSFQSLQSFLDLAPKSIEIIPDNFVLQADQAPSPSPFLYLDRNLGIPQKTLLKLYVHASRALISSRMFADLVHITSDESHKDEISFMIACTSVVLIANPAHCSSLNLRKILIQKGIQSAQTELKLLEALIICSKDCAKQSLIWHHRRWLFGILYPRVSHLSTRIEDISELPRLPLAILRNELSLLHRACEVYPRNYYAWIQFYFCSEVLYDIVVHSTDTEQEMAYQALADHISSIKAWIDQHISDYSAMQHICHLCRRFFQQSLPPSPTHASELDNISPASLFDHSLSLLSFYPDHESLWLYLRNAVRLNTDADQRTKMVDKAMSCAIFVGPLADACATYWKICDNHSHAVDTVTRRPSSRCHG